MTGLIVKALSGFYYVDCGGDIIQCKPRGKFRYEKVSPLVGDRVDITPTEPGKGRLDTIHPRKNQFQRPAVANMDSDRSSSPPRLSRSPTRSLSTGWRPSPS